jgi:UDP-2,4-diacetamido-2,4,6-trideoxy-beta-L-altropyranose hydrolase
MGTGHVMRCLALAQAWQDAGGAVFLASAEIPSGLRDRVEREGVGVLRIRETPGSVDDAEALVRAAAEAGAAWIAVDGYQFDVQFQRRLRRAEVKVLLVDDLGRGEHYYADAILNQNAYAEKGLYTTSDPGTLLLLGTRYAVLRREFARWGEGSRDISGVASKVLVTMGGSDPPNVTATVIEALGAADVPDIQVAVVIGTANPHWGSESPPRRWPLPVSVERDVQDMCSHMAWADAAITAAGSTLWELCALGVPCVAIALADNQVMNLAFMEARGAVLSAGVWNEPLLPERIRQRFRHMQPLDVRRTLSMTGRGLVDGGGAARVVAALHGAATPGEVAA